MAGLFITWFPAVLKTFMALFVRFLRSVADMGARPVDFPNLLNSAVQCSTMCVIGSCFRLGELLVNSYRTSIDTSSCTHLFQTKLLI